MKFYLEIDFSFHFDPTSILKFNSMYSSMLISIIVFDGKSRHRILQKISNQYIRKVFSLGSLSYLDSNLIISSNTA